MPYKNYVTYDRLGRKGALSHKGKFEDRVDCFYFNPFDACRLAQAVVNLRGCDIPALIETVARAVMSKSVVYWF